MARLVSAIIPTYNYARFVGRAVDSVLAQTYAPVECIVVDDGSKDETPEVLARYGDRIRVIRQPNAGLSAARNTGIRAARGEILGFLDSDDAWEPGKLARQVAELEAHPDDVVVGCAGRVLEDGEGAPPRHWRIRPSAPELPERLRQMATRDSWVEGTGSGVLMHRRVLDAVGLFDEDLRAAEDWDMWMRIAARFRIVNLPDVLVARSLHGTGSFRNADLMERNQWKVYRHAIERWPEMLDGRTRRRMRALILSDAGGELLFAREWNAALGKYLASLREWPFRGRTWKLVARLLLRRVGI